MQRGLRSRWVLGGGIVLVAAVAAGLSLFVPGGVHAAQSSDYKRAMAFVEKKCPGQQRAISHQMWETRWGFNALYGNCLAADGGDQHIWFFDHGRFVGTDARTRSHDIIGLWRNRGTVAFMYVLYRQSDPRCCATGGGAIVRFRWNGKHARPLEPLPRPAYTKGAAVGR